MAGEVTAGSIDESSTIYVPRTCVTLARALDEPGGVRHGAMLGLVACPRCRSTRYRWLLLRVRARKPGTYRQRNSRYAPAASISSRTSVFGLDGRVEPDTCRAYEMVLGEPDRSETETIGELRLLSRLAVER